MNAPEFWTHESVRAAIGGSWLARPGPLPALAGGAAIDTRALTPGQIFFALRGERTDGHRFLPAALGAGAALAVIDDENAAGPLPPGLPVLRVTSARTALGRLAGAYRAALGSIRAIAVTGSNGKTSTTRMIDACLRSCMRGHCSPKSYNNDLGVPLTILGAAHNDQYLLCEVGANAPGEIEPLSRMVRPHIAVITSIGRAHIECLGSLDGIAAEKASLASHLEPGGAVVLNADAPQLIPWRARFERVITFGTNPDADLRVSGVRQSGAGLAFSLNEHDAYSLPVLGVHNASNAAAAIAVARRLGVPDDAIRAALAAYTPPDMRLARERIGAIDLINDAYNANPESMLAALRTLRAVAPAGSRRVAVLGDMLEMGPDGPDNHREVALAVSTEHLADAAILVGPLAGLMADTLADGGIETARFDSAAGASADEAAGLLRPGDTVLLKGSRGVGLERIAAALRARRAPSPAQGGPA